MAPLPNIFEQAKLSHQLFHQNAPGLVRRFHLTREQAKEIVAACPSCSQHAVPTITCGGLNPPIIRHFGASSPFNIKEKPLVMVRDPESRRTEGPHDRMSTPTGPRWVPSKWFDMATSQTGFPAPRSLHLILGAVVTLSLCLPVDGWLVPQPKANVWATLVKAMGQDHICLSATSADSPLSTCLVGIPFKPQDFPPKFQQIVREMLYNLVATTHSPTVNHLAMSSPEDPEAEELELEEGLGGAPEDEEGRNPDEEEHGLGYPTQREWFAETYPESEYLPPPFQFRSS
ncbi:hypothetical protein DUI87_13022 [Hirundo rustica rustica]|uniref:Integrase-type domain-containing protein n=1 Tax=Hirundo rustica rustica TaxID=333673 RepID=A0A3M0KCJ1_HIRRU|nr:hypothetical protein DUI87_13022 [Hirundo rustica rustica]